MSQLQSESETEAASGESSETGRLFGIPIHNGIAVGTVLLGILLWEIAAQFAFDRLEIVFPSLLAISGELYWLFASGEIYPHLLITAQQVGIAFLIAVVVGVGGGTALGMNQFVAEAVEPILYYFSSIPKIVLYPLFLVALGIGIESKIAMGFLSALFPIAVNSIVGSLSVREDLVRVAKVNGATRYQVFKHVYLPSMVTHIVNGLRLGVGVAIISVVLAELFASQAGMGNRISFYFGNLLTARMYATMVVLFVAALVLNLSLLRVQDYLNRTGYGDADAGSTFGF
jgi:ABC-type nitrate/sulfonate/bicarbonate transport system permease component